jgi:hypothetical protein
MRYVVNGRGERVRKELATKPAVGRDLIYDESGRLLAEYTDRNDGSKDTFGPTTPDCRLAGTGTRDVRFQYVYTTAS